MHSSLLLSIACVLVQSSNFSGTWEGDFNISAGRGHTEHAHCILYLKKRPEGWLGAIGSDPDDLSPLKGIRTEGGKLSFQMAKGGNTLAFTTSLNQSELTGSASGNLGANSVTVDLNLHKSSKIRTLYEKIEELDGKLFDAFNARDLATIKRLFTKDLEFYHDKNGLADYKANMDSFSRTFANPARVRRELDLPSLEIYPVKGFGAMEIGVHRFYTAQPGMPEQLTATAKFVHVWRNTSGRWQICRVVSYAHE